MNEKAFRLDFFIAIAALLVSAFTSITLLYQTRVISQQYAATIWPYLGVSSTYGGDGEKIQVTNEGLGPALIRSAQLFVDGKPVPTWNDYLAALMTVPDIHALIERAARARTAPQGTISTASIGPSATVRPGDSKTLLLIKWQNDLPISDLTLHEIAIDFCYCSLNGSCWTLHATPGRDNPSTPQPVSHCATAATIGSYAMSPVGKSGRRRP